MQTISIDRQYWLCGSILIENPVFWKSSLILPFYLKNKENVVCTVGLSHTSFGVYEDDSCRSGPTLSPVRQDLLNLSGDYHCISWKKYHRHLRKYHVFLWVLLFIILRKVCDKLPFLLHVRVLKFKWYHLEFFFASTVKIFSYYVTWSCISILSSKMKSYR
jgi:hypothetical protein